MTLWPFLTDVFLPAGLMIAVSIFGLFLVIAFWKMQNSES